MSDAPRLRRRSLLGAALAAAALPLLVSFVGLWVAIGFTGVQAIGAEANGAGAGVALGLVAFMSGGLALVLTLAAVPPAGVWVLTVTAFARRWYAGGASVLTGAACGALCGLPALALIQTYSPIRTEGVYLDLRPWLMFGVAIGSVIGGVLVSRFTRPTRWRAVAQ